MKIIKIPPGEHSILGPSSAKRWINCPGSVFATKDIKEPASEYAAEGTVAHYVAELCRLNQQDAKVYKGQKFESEGHVFECNDEMVEAVNEFCEYVADHEGTHIFETRVNFEEWVPGGFGRSDHAALGKTCHVFDLKYGKGVQVYAENNEQGMCYALGIYHDFGWMYDFEEFVIHICQPRLNHWDSWTISKTDLLNWATRVLRPAARKTLELSAPFNAGDWCQFCKIRATCRVRAESVLTPPQGEFEDLDATNLIDVPTLTNEEVDRALKQRDNFQKWYSDLAVYAMAEIKAGRPVGEWKLVLGDTHRKWKDEKPGMVAGLKQRGLKDEDIWEPATLRSPAKLEKKLPKKEREFLKPYFEKPPGKPTLAPGDDPREAVSTDALGGFDDLDADAQE